MGNLPLSKMRFAPVETILSPSLWREREANAAINQQTRNLAHTVVTTLLDGDHAVFTCVQEVA
jgi:hypothetical protein